MNKLTGPGGCIALRLLWLSHVITLSIFGKWYSSSFLSLFPQSLGRRNKFVKGDKVEILSPAITGDSFVVNELYNEEGETIEGCPHPGMICKVKVPYQLEKNTFIRKELVKI